MVALVPFKSHIVVCWFQHFILPADIISDCSHCLISGFFFLLAKAEVYVFHGNDIQKSAAADARACGRYPDLPEPGEAKSITTYLLNLLEIKLIEGRAVLERVVPDFLQRIRKLYLFKIPAVSERVCADLDKPGWEGDRIDARIPVAELLPEGVRM